MRGRIQQRPAHLLLPRWQELYPAAEWMPEQPSFHASLLDCAQKSEEQIIASPIERETIEGPVAPPAPQPAATVAKLSGPSSLKRAWTWLQEKNAAATARQIQTSGVLPVEGNPDRRPEPKQALRNPSSNLLARGWSWLQEKSGASPTKRLRVADFTALGEKRFVALVKVEGREFLIGGGASGVSLLTKLDAAEEPANDLRRQFGFQEES
jgi:Flagellar biosynthesis protein, FliO